MKIVAIGTGQCFKDKDLPPIKMGRPFFYNRGEKR